MHRASPLRCVLAWVASAALSLVPLGCGGPSSKGGPSGGGAKDSGAEDSSGAADGGGDSAGTDSPAPPTCGEGPALALAPEARPGDTLAVAVGWTVAPEGEVSAFWSADLGDLSGDAAGADWALPADEAVHVDVLATVTLSVEQEGCPALQVSGATWVGFPEAERVLTLANEAVEGSVEVAEAYAAFRGLPADHRCLFTFTDSTTIAVEEAMDLYDTLQACLEAAGPQIEYIVPVYGVPYKVSGQIPDFASGALTTTSLDALLFFGQRARVVAEAKYNPWYQEGNSAAAVYEPYVPVGALREGGGDYYIVTRIDGADAEAALALLDRTAEAEALRDAGGLDGVVYVDGNRGDTPPTSDEFGSYESGEWNMWGTRAAFEADGRWPVVWDGQAEEFGTAPAPTDCPDALFYAGWYSFYNYNDCFTWAPGAIGGHLDSCSACELRAAGTWAGSALLDGITATYGAVNEPYVAGMPEYDQLYRYLLEGANYGEAAYESTVVAGWMMVFVGDPLYRPLDPP